MAIDKHCCAGMLSTTLKSGTLSTDTKIVEKHSNATYIAELPKQASMFVSIIDSMNDVVISA